ncbi:MAG: LytTR family transcriptional regulator [Bacteroidales bacterium]|nr:LytTR family transcriptional regulator [Bacteroidales bacterium]
MNDTRIPKAVYSLKNTVVFGIGTTLYAFLIAVLFEPSFGYDNIEVWKSHSALAIPVLCAIVAGSIAISRMLLLLTTHRSRLHVSEYLLWQLGELALVALFADLFIAIYFHLEYFAMLHATLLIAVAVLAVPYVVYWLYIALADSNAQLAEARADMLAVQQRVQTGDREPLRLADEKGIVRLVLPADKVIAIESAGNYVTITHDASGHATRFSLRNTLKGLEHLCQQGGLVRCHRSYFVNLHRVKLLRKDPDSLYAEIDTPGVADVPVSKTYSAEVVHLFSLQ